MPRYNTYEQLLSCKEECISWCAYLKLGLNSNNHTAYKEWKETVWDIEKREEFLRQFEEVFGTKENPRTY